MAGKFRTSVRLSRWFRQAGSATEARCIQWTSMKVRSRCRTVGSCVGLALIFTLVTPYTYAAASQPPPSWHGELTAISLSMQ